MDKPGTTRGKPEANCAGIRKASCPHTDGPLGLDRNRDLVSEIFWLKILEREGAEDDPKKAT